MVHGSHLWLTTTNIGWALCVSFLTSISSSICSGKLREEHGLGNFMIMQQPWRPSYSIRALEPLQIVNGYGSDGPWSIKCQVLCRARYFLYFVYFHDYFKSQVFLLSLYRYKNRFRDIKWLIIITQELKKLFSQVSLIQKPMLFCLSLFASFRREMGQDKDKDENMHIHSVMNALAPWIIILILLLL